MMNWKEMIGSLFLCILVCSFTSEKNPLEKSKVVAKIKEIEGNKVTVCNYKALPSDEVQLPLSWLAEELQIVKLDDKEEALVGRVSKVIVSENYILVGNQQQNPCKLFDKKGNFIANVGAFGQGPGEYQLIYDQAIDEKNGYIYLMPWSSRNILVYDLNGKFVKNISTMLFLPKSCFWLNPDNGSISIALLATEKYPAAAYTINSEGKVINPVKPGPLAVSGDGIYNNEVYSLKSTGEKDFFISRFFDRCADTLYHYDVAKSALLPKFTVDFPGDIPIHSLWELPDYYLGNSSEEVKESDGNFSTTPPRFYIIDKKTLKGSYFKFINDYLGGMGISVYNLNNGYFVQCWEPGNLEEAISKFLSSGTKISKEMRKKLTDLQKSIDENDNNYILYAKMKK